MESDVLKAVEEISGYTPDEMLDMYNDYGRMAKEWEAYAGTGLTPEEIAHAKDLLAAEKDGRLVTLPCKVGDTINAFRYSKEKGGLYILSDKVTSVTTNKNGYTVKTKSMFYPIKQKEGYYFAQISEYPNACADYYVGERAEAEKALEKEAQT